MKKILFLLYFLILNGCCYHTFRTGEVLNKGEQSINFNISPVGGRYDEIERKVNFIFPIFPINSSIHYRRGREEGEWGIKLYYLGIEPTISTILTKEKNKTPATALEIGLGTYLWKLTIVMNATVVTSKRLGQFSIYGGGKLNLINLIKFEENRAIVPGFFIGVNIQAVFLETYIGGLYSPGIPYGPGEVVFGAICGAGVRIKW